MSKITCWSYPIDESSERLNESPVQSLPKEPDDDVVIDEESVRDAGEDQEEAEFVAPLPLEAVLWVSVGDN